MTTDKKPKISWLLLGYCLTAHAEVTLDGSLTAPGTIGFHDNTYLIDSSAGRLVEHNLFHSFARFNIETGTLAHFTDSSHSAIAHVIARVTGGQSSTIDGTIRSSIGQADLYLINPAGMVFGPNAQLDVPGSFYASTAASVKMANGGEFSAITRNDPILLSAPPAAFGFLDNAADLSVQGSHLAPQLDQSISLSAGNINLTNAELSSIGGSLELTAVGSNSEQTQTAQGHLFIDNSGIATNSSRDGYFGNILLSAGTLELNNSSVTTLTDNASRGGNIAILSAQAAMTNTWINAMSLGEGAPGSVAIATDTLLLDATWLNNTVAGNSRSDGSYGIGITSGDLLAQNDSRINVWTSADGDGDAGNLFIDASRSITLTGQTETGKTGLFTFNGEDSTGNAGILSINTPALTITDGAQISTLNRNTGLGGAINITAARIFMDNADIKSYTFAGGSGGSITINTDELSGINGADIALSTSTEGNAGNLSLTATQAINFYGQEPETGLFSGISTDNAVGSSGNSGTLLLDSPLITLGQGSSLSAGNYGSGKAGIIMLTGADTITLNGGSIDVSTSAGASGMILIDTGDLLINNGGYISASTYGSGNGGDIVVNASRHIDIRDGIIDQSFSGIFAGSYGSATGNASNIFLNTPTLSLSNLAFIDLSTAGSGHAGNLSINADYITIDHATLSSATLGSGQGGNIVINAQNIALKAGGIATFTNGEGAAGGIQITAAQQLSFSGTGSNLQVTATSDSTGTAGQIDITTPLLTLDDGALIDASTLGQGDTQGIHIAAETLHVLNGSIIESSSDGPGFAGDILIKTNNLRIAGAKSYIFDGQAQQTPSRIRVSTLGSGDAGDILIGGLAQTFAQTIELDHQGYITASSGGIADDSGNGGSIYLFAEDITLDHNAGIRAFSDSSARAGYIGINSFNNAEVLQKLAIDSMPQAYGHTLNLLNGSDINVESVQGEAGDVEIYLDKSLYSLASKITTTAAGGTGAGGNIFIDPQFVMLNNSQIIANAQLGHGGLIKIITEFYLPSSDSLLSASSASGNPELQGTISIQSQYSNIASSIAVLPDNLLDISNMLNEDCAAAAAKASSFTLGTRGGLPLAPDNFLIPGLQSLQCGVGL